MTMTPAELFRSWHEDTADHAIIWCTDWSPFFSTRMPSKCEACGRLISAFPVVLAKLGPRFHVVCREKCMAIGLEVCGPVPFGGRIADNVLPEKLREFGSKL
jgi:hypothetical protein